MSTRIWNGSTADFGVAADWSPAGVPVSGDVAMINSGAVTISGLDLLANVIVQANHLGAGTNLTLNNAVVAAGDQIVLLVSDPGTQTLNLVGGVTNNGLISFQRTQNIAGYIFPKLSIGGTLTNNGEIDLFSQGTYISGTGPAPFVNNGSVVIRNLTGLASDNYSINTMNLALSGTGSVDVGTASRLGLYAVGSGQTISMEGSGGYFSIVDLNVPIAFHGTIANFTASDFIYLTGIGSTTSQVASSGGFTTVSFSSGSGVVATVRLQGSFTSDQLTITKNALGSGDTTSIQTSVPDGPAAPTPSIPTPVGSPTAAALPSVGVYRFFDKVLGTHFFTANAAEAATTDRNRPDLVDEGIGLHAVNPLAGDPAATAVYRFFDTKFGTHFFTASASERNDLLANRHDLTFEPDSTFSEHAVAQTGDVPVYRYFDQVHGTHFYTADTGERASIAATRADLVSEGIGFYAPSH